MKASDMDLDRLLVRRPEDGILELRGSRCIIADAAATYRLAEELDETIGREAARGVLTRLGYQTGYQEAARLRTHFDWESDLEWLLAGPRTQSILGGGRLAVDQCVVDRARGVFLLSVGATNAFEAEEHKRRRGVSADHVCDRLVGYLSGFATAFLGDDVLFREESCAARGEAANDCRFVGRPSAEWGEEGERDRALYRHDAIGERLASRDREILEQAIKIREQELALGAKKKVEEANRLKSEFLANISHELRTPLNAILGYADLLLVKLGPKLPPVPKQNLERILSNADHLLGLINSILDLSKVEAGKMTVHCEDLSPGELLDRCLEDARVLLKDKPVELVRAYDAAALPTVHADRVKLRQCLTNILGNACKFTSRGTIRVETRTIAGQRSGLKVGFLAIAVTDTGPGIAAEHHGLIFEPFRQADASASREHGGTGLGLPIVRQLLGLMGGEVHVTSSLGAGSTFTIVVPLSAVTPQKSRDAGSGDPEILLVDDDPDFAAIVREALGEASGADGPLARARLRVERDPVVAIAAARVRAPSLILLDLRLPSIDGLEVLRLLREDERTRDVPVVVTSGRADAASALGLGATQVLSKPLQPQALVACVTRILEGKGAPP